MKQPQRLRRQFSLRGLLIVMALSAVVFGMGRWLWHFVNDRPSYEMLVQATESRGAMEPTINGREILAAHKNAYWKARPSRFEIVAFDRSGPNTGRVLRLIGLPGETVSFAGGKIVIDGRELVLPPQLQSIRFRRDISDESVPYPFTVPNGCYYLLGDNPDKANDSRMWGALPAEKILGRVYR